MRTKTTRMVARFLLYRLIGQDNADVVRELVEKFEPVDSESAVKFGLVRHQLKTILDDDIPNYRINISIELAVVIQRFN